MSRELPRPSQRMARTGHPNDVQIRLVRRTTTRGGNHIPTICLLLSCHPVVIKIFFLVLILCTAAVVAVTLAIHFKVKKHLRPDAVSPVSRPEITEAETGKKKKSSEMQGVSDEGTGESHPPKSS